MERIRRTGLTAEQYQRLIEGLPALGELSSTILVPYPVYKLKDCSVVWLNYRWFSERGFHLSDEETKQAIEHWMIEEFGYVSNPPEHESIPSSFDRIFHADRYGSNNTLFAHGGSGRGTVVDRFHAKGVGPTPLVGEGVNREHSHGNASLNVAIREAIYSEIVANEFPSGAVSILGILDAGISFESSSTPGKMLKRAIIVRPGMVRPAHMQRAAGFIAPADGHKNSQSEDANRARDLVRYMISLGKDEPIGKLRELFCSVAQQVAFGQVHRIYNGGYFSSNLTINGELLDFGNTYVFPDWCNAKVLDNDLGFGRELDSLALTAHSLSFHLHKYAGIPVDSLLARELIELAHKTHRESFDTEMLRIWGLADAGGDGARILGFMKGMYKKHQKIAVSYSLGRSSDLISLGLREGCSEKSDSSATATAVEKMMNEIGCATFSPNDKRRMRITAQRYLHYRRTADRTWLQRESEALIASTTDQKMKDDISKFINDCISQSRRHWPLLPADLLVIAQCSDLDSFALYCTDGEENLVIWIEGSLVNDALVVFGKEIEQRTCDRFTRKGARAGFSVAASVRDGRCFVDRLSLEIPRPDLIYDDAEFMRLVST